MYDNEIMELYFRRDKSAIARTKEKYDVKCKAIAFNVLRNRQDAEEAVADAYLAVWNRIGKERPASFSAYLFKVVRNQSLTKYDLVNASKRKPIRQLEELDECIPSGFDLQKVAESADTSTLTYGTNNVWNKIYQKIMLTDLLLQLCTQTYQTAAQWITPLWFTGITIYRTITE